MARSIYFFATRGDLLPVLLEIERTIDIHYCEGGYSRIYDGEGELAGIPTFAQYSTARDIIGLSHTEFDSSVSGRTILIGHDSTPFLPEAIPQRRGGMRLAMTIGSDLNDDAILLRPGGIYDALTLLAGEVATTHEPTEKGIQLIEAIRKVVRSRWILIRPYWLGAEAQQMLNRGVRLTSGVRTPACYDLRRPENPNKPG